jgi:hypothetical protein
MTPEKMMQTVRENLRGYTGRTLKEWVVLLRMQGALTTKESMA